MWDSLAQSAARDIISFRTLCETLWQPFIQPIIDGLYGVRQSQELSKLLVRNRGLLQSESALIPNVVLAPPDSSTPSHQNPAATSGERFLAAGGGGGGAKNDNTTTTLLPSLPSYILISAYLASYTHPRHDIPLFSRSSLSKRRKKGGGTALSRQARSGASSGTMPPPLTYIYTHSYSLLSLPLSQPQIETKPPQKC